MKSRVADEARAALRARAAAMTPEQRIETALRMGRELVSLYAQVQGIDQRTAARRLDREKQKGRTPSKCAMR